MVPGPPVALKAGETVTVPLTVQIRGGYHINSNQPNEDYLIPTRLTWTAAPAEVKDIRYPEPEQVTYGLFRQAAVGLLGPDRHPHDLPDARTAPHRANR